MVTEVACEGEGVDTLGRRWFWVSATCIRGKVCLLILVITGKKKMRL